MKRSRSESTEDDFHQDFLTSYPVFSDNIIDEVLSSSSSEDYSNTFIPDETERQIVRCALANLRRANYFDWDIDNGIPGFEQMCITSFNLIGSDTYEINVFLEYMRDITVCNIDYRIQGEETFSKLSLEWDSYGIDASDNLTVVKHVVESFLLVFSAPKRYLYEVVMEDTRELSWCYFDDVRIHLHRISP